MGMVIDFLSCTLQEWTKEDILNVIFTCRQVNTIPEKTLSLYNIVLIGEDLSQLETTQSAMESCYSCVSVCYWHNSSLASRRE